MWEAINKEDSDRLVSSYTHNNMVVKSSRKGKGPSVSEKMHEIRKCNDLRARIKKYCQQESLTQPQFAEKLHVSASQISLFMTGSTLTGSEVYTQAMKYLKTRMPISKVSEDERAHVINNKFKFTYGGLNVHAWVYFL